MTQPLLAVIAIADPQLVLVEAAAALLTDNLKFYPLSKFADQPEMKWVSGCGADGFEDQRDPTDDNCRQLLATETAGGYAVPLC